MKWRAQRAYPGRGYETRPVGPWRRNFPAALADARTDITPQDSRCAVWEVKDSRGNVREISETQWDRGIDEYHGAISHRDRVGVWG